MRTVAVGIYERELADAFSIGLASCLDLSGTTVVRRDDTPVRKSPRENIRKQWVTVGAFIRNAIATERPRVK